MAKCPYCDTEFPDNELKCPKCNHEFNGIDDIPYPSKPNFWYEITLGCAEIFGLHIGGILYLLVPFLSFLFFCESETLSIMLTIWVVDAIFILGVGAIKYWVAKGNYDYIIKDWEGYKERNKSMHELNKSGGPFKSLSATTANLPKCPLCGSTKIKKISTTKKLVSIGVLGAASNDIGKQRQCESCGYKF